MILPRLEWLLPEPFPDPPPFAGFGRPVATLLARRGFRDDEQLDRFLHAGEASLHDVFVTLGSGSPSGATTTPMG